MKNQLLFGHISTLVFGGLIYILFRANSLLMFDWFYDLSLGHTINSLRNVVSSLRVFLPSWFLFSFPDGLWVFSYVSLMLLIWGNKLHIQSVFWILIVPFIALGSELAQYVGYITGTFDITDIVFYVLGTIVPIFLYVRK